MSDEAMCGLCLESMGLPHEVCRIIVARWRRDAGTIAVLRARISQLEKQITPTPNAVPPRNCKCNGHKKCRKSCAHHK